MCDQATTKCLMVIFSLSLFPKSSFDTLLFFLHAAGINLSPSFSHPLVLTMFLYLMRVISLGIFISLFPLGLFLSPFQLKSCSARLVSSTLRCYSTVVFNISSSLVFIVEKCNKGINYSLLL